MDLEGQRSPWRWKTETERRVVGGVVGRVVGVVVVVYFLVIIIIIVEEKEEVSSWSRKDEGRKESCLMGRTYIRT